jgi:hypothetical protein
VLSHGQRREKFGFVLPNNPYTDDLGSRKKSRSGDVTRDSRRAGGTNAGRTLLFQRASFASLVVNRIESNPQNQYRSPYVKA